MGPTRPGHGDDPGHGRHGEGRPGGGRPRRARAGRGDHPLDDAARAARPERPQRLPPAPDRRRVGDQPDRRQQAHQAVRRDAEAHEAAVRGAAGRRALAAVASSAGARRADPSDHTDTPRTAPRTPPAPEDVPGVDGADARPSSRPGAARGLRAGRIARRRGRAHHRSAPRRRCSCSPARRPRRPSRATSRPAAYVYAEARLDLPGDQRQRLANFLSHFPGFDDQAIFDQKIDEALDRLMGEGSKGEVTYTRDIKPWLGDSIALVGTGLPAGHQVTGEQAAIPRDHRHEGPGCSEDLARRADDGGRPARRPTTGIEISVRSGDDATMPLPGRSLDKVLVAGDIGSVKAAIDTERNELLRVVAIGSRAAAAAIPGDRLRSSSSTPPRSWRPSRTCPDMRRSAADQLARLPAWAAGRPARSSRTRSSSSRRCRDGRRPAGRERTRQRAGAGPARRHDRRARGPRHRGAHHDASSPACKSRPETRRRRSRSSRPGRDARAASRRLLGWIGDATIVVAGAGSRLRRRSRHPGHRRRRRDRQASASLRNLVRSCRRLAGHHAVATSRTATARSRRSTSATSASTRISVPTSASRSPTPSPAGRPRRRLATTFVKAVARHRAGRSLADQPRYRAAVDRAGAANIGQVFVDVPALVAASFVESRVPASRARRRSNARYLPYLRPFSRARRGRSTPAIPLRSRTSRSPFSKPNTEETARPWQFASG